MEPCPTSVEAATAASANAAAGSGEAGPEFASSSGVIRPGRRAARGDWIPASAGICKLSAARTDAGNLVG